MNESTYCLKHLTDTELLDGLANLCRRSNELTAELLAHLAEVELRRLHVVRGYSSMFEYCLSRFGHTEDEAGRRIHAARAAQRFPELSPMLARGEMHLSTINLIAARFDDNDEVARSLIAAASNKSKRQVEQMLTARFQKPDAPTRLVPLASTPAAAAKSVRAEASAALPLFAAKATAAPSSACVAAPEGEARACDTAGPTSPAAAPAPSQPVPPSSDAKVARFRLQVTISREARDHLLRAQALLAHNIPDGDVGRVLERALALLCEDLEAKKFAKLKRHATTPATPAPTAPRAASQATAAAPTSDGTPAAPAEPVPGRATATDSAADASPALASARPADHEGTTAPGAPSDSNKSVARKRRGESGVRPRTIPRAVKRQVAERDGCRCTYVSPEGVRCTETRRLEYNRPFARGGEATVDGVNLLCRLHNDLQARRDFGEAYRQAVKARRRAERGKHRGPT